MYKLKRIIEYGLYLLVFLLPWQTRWIIHQGKLNGGNWEYGSFSLYGFDLLLIFLLILSLIVFFKKKDLKINTVYYFLAFFELISFFSIFSSHDKVLAFYGWFRLLLSLGLFFLLTSIVKEKKFLKNISFSLILAGILQSLLSFYQFFTQSVFANKWLGIALHSPSSLGTFVVENMEGRWLRVYGSFSHPNLLASFLVIIIFFLFYLWKENYKRVFLIISFPIILSSLFLTFSRSAWLAFIIGLLILFFTNKEKINYKFLLIPGMIMIIFLSFLFYSPLKTRLSGQGRLEERSNQERINYYQEAYALFKKNLFLGIGINNYTLGIYYQDKQRQAWDYQPVHNLYFLILAELGLLGFLSFLAFLIYFLKRTSFNILILIILFLSFFDHYFWSLNFGIIFFWLILALVEGGVNFNRYLKEISIKE